MRLLVKSRSRRVIVGGALTLIAGSMLACPEVTPPPPLPGVTEVAMRNIAFDPNVVTIKVGESVRWTNFDGLTTHTATSGNPGEATAGSIWDSPFLQTGESFSHQFDQVGEFVYFCRVHPVMMRDAMVKVEP